MIHVYFTLSLFLLTLCQLASANDLSIEYEKQPGVAGSITSVGSDTLANLMTNWSVEFRQLYPQVKFQIQASGSSTAPPALTEGAASIGPMSRGLKANEVSYFSRKHGYRPLVVTVAIDAIGIFVDVGNPLPGLSLAQVDGIFSSTRFCGAPQSITFWRDVGVTNGYANKRIKAYGRNSVSGTYGLFKQLALCNGDFLPSVNELPGSSSVIQSVAYSNGAIGYAALTNQSVAVRALPIANAQGDFIDADIESIASGDYPLTRSLYLVVNKPPDTRLPLLEQEFLRFVLSKVGQRIVRQEGYIPLPEVAVQKQLNAILSVRQ